MIIAGWFINLTRTLYYLWTEREKGRERKETGKKIRQIEQDVFRNNLNVSWKAGAIGQMTSWRRQMQEVRTAEQGYWIGKLFPEIVVSCRWCLNCTFNSKKERIKGISWVRNCEKVCPINRGILKSFDCNASNEFRDKFSIPDQYEIY